MRPARRTDLAVLSAHRLGMWRDIESVRPEGRRWTDAELDRSLAVYRRWAAREMRAGHLVGFVVETLDGRPVGSGMLWLQPVQPRPGPDGGFVQPYIHSMFTDPAFRGRGVASRIVRALVRWAEDRGYSRIALHASPMGRPVYERLGFAPSREMRLELPSRRRRARAR